MRRSELSGCVTESGALSQRCFGRYRAFDKARAWEAAKQQISKMQTNMPNKTLILRFTSAWALIESAQAKLVGGSGKT